MNFNTKLIFFILMGLTFIPAQAMQQEKLQKEKQIFREETLITLNNIKNDLETTFKEPNLDNISRAREQLEFYLSLEDIDTEIVNLIMNLNSTLSKQITFLEQAFVETLWKLSEEERKYQPTLDPELVKGFENEKETLSQLIDDMKKEHEKEITDLYYKEFDKLKQEDNKIPELFKEIYKKIAQLKQKETKPVVKKEEKIEIEIEEEDKPVKKEEPKQVKKQAPTLPKKETRETLTEVRKSLIKPEQKKQEEKVVIEISEKPEIKKSTKTRHSRIESQPVEFKGKRRTIKRTELPFFGLEKQEKEKIEKQKLDKQKEQEKELKSRLQKQTMGTGRERGGKEPELSPIEKRKIKNLKEKLETRQTECLDNNPEMAERIGNLLEMPDRELLILTGDEIEKMIDPSYVGAGFVKSTFKPGVQKEEEVSLEKKGTNLGQLYNMAKEVFKGRRFDFDIEEERFRKKKK